MVAVFTALVGVIVIVPYLWNVGTRSVIVDRAKQTSRHSSNRLIWLQKQLDEAGIALPAQNVVVQWLVITLASAMVAFAISPGLVIGVAVSAIVMPFGAFYMTRSRMRSRIHRALPEVVDAIANQLEVGFTVHEALVQLGERKGPMQTQLQSMVRALQLNIPLREVLQQWSKRSASLRSVGGALTVAATVGGPTAGPLRDLAASLRDRLRVIAETRSMSTQARLSAIVVGCGPLLFLAFSLVSDPGSVSVLVTTGIGRASFAAGLTLNVLALLWMQRIVRIPAWK